MRAALDPAELECVAERPEHSEAIERLLDRAFGPGRFAKTSERVRERFARFEPGYSRVAILSGAGPVGCCRIHRIGLGGRDIAFLGPLAVDPLRQHAGLGARLIAASLDALEAGGDLPAVLLVGAPALFAPHGFTRTPEGRVTFPGPVDPARTLWRALRSGDLEGLAGEITPPAATPA